jgi:hypothetical protein
MNPTITESFIRGEIERDPEAGRSEWLALFREDITAAFSLESIEQCVIKGRSELLPAPNIPYRAFADPSGGRYDWFSVAVAHRVNDVAIIDLIKAWRPPFDPSDIVKQCAEVLKPFRVTNIVGDNYAGAWPQAEFAKHGITYEYARRTEANSI